MMKILSINKEIIDNALTIESISESELSTHPKLSSYDYIIINGGDGTIRRVMKLLLHTSHKASFILNPTGSFNVIAKLHRVPKLEQVLEMLKTGEKPSTQPQKIYTLNEEVFLFSAGNMGDLQHIFLSETLRFGLLEKGLVKYLLAGLFLFPIHLLMTPFMLLSSRRFFIFTPASFIQKFGSFYGVVKTMEIDLENHYNLIELDGDIVIIKEHKLHIQPAGEAPIVI